MRNEKGRKSVVWNLYTILRRAISFDIVPNSFTRWPRILVKYLAFTQLSLEFLFLPIVRMVVITLSDAVSI